MVDLQALTDTLKTFAQEGTDFIYVAALVAGIALSLFALKDLIAKGQGQYDKGGQAKSWGAISLRLVLGSCLVTLASKLDLIIATNGNTEPLRQALAYAQGSATGGGGSTTLTLIWAAVSTWVVFLGTAGFMRGFLLFDKASQGGQDSGDTFWRGLWHVIGGAICVNVFS